MVRTALRRALLGSRAPLGLKIFLTALAIADDLGAVVVIALFYTSDLDVVALVAAALAFGVSLSLNRLGVRSPIPYAVVGVVLWFATLKSVVHATVAGVLQAFAIPSRPEIPTERFAARVRALVGRLERSPAERADVVHELAHGCVQVEAPLTRIEHALAPYTSFVVMPVFALANAGVALSGGFGAALASPGTLGIAFGLLIGKPLGVAGAAWVEVEAGFVTCPYCEETLSSAVVFADTALVGLVLEMKVFRAESPDHAERIAKSVIGKALRDVPLKLLDVQPI